MDKKLRSENSTSAIAPPTKATGVNHRKGYGREIAYSKIDEAIGLKDDAMSEDRRALSSLRQRNIVFFSPGCVGTLVYTVLAASLLYSRYLSVLKIP